MTVDWDAYRSMLEVVRNGSLDAAARAQGLAVPTLRRRIHRLEDAWGLSLFSSGPGRMAATPAALRLSGLVEEMSQLAARRPVGAVAATLAVTHLFAAFFLPAVLRRFDSALPGKRVSVVTATWDDVAFAKDADVKLMLHPTQEMLASCRSYCVGRVELGLFASRTYLERRGTPKSTDELAGHRRIGSTIQPVNEWFGDVLGLADWSAGFDYQTNWLPALLSALDRGVGIAVGPASVLGDRRKVVRVLPHVKYEMDLWVLRDKREDSDPEVDAVIALICDELRKSCNRHEATYEVS